MECWNLTYRWMLPLTLTSKGERFPTNKDLVWTEEVASKHGHCLTIHQCNARNTVYCLIILPKKAPSDTVLTVNSRDWGLSKTYVKLKTPTSEEIWHWDIEILCGATSSTADPCKTLAEVHGLWWRAIRLQKILSSSHLQFELQLNTVLQGLWRNSCKWSLLFLCVWLSALHFYNQLSVAARSYLLLHLLSD